MDINLKLYIYYFIIYVRGINMKKFIAMLMIFSSIFSMQVSASTLATKWDDGVHGTEKYM